LDRAVLVVVERDDPRRIVENPARAKEHTDRLSKVDETPQPLGGLLLQPLGVGEDRPV
jgi:hypothetical protein